MENNMAKRWMLLGWLLVLLAACTTTTTPAPQLTTTPQTISSATPVAHTPTAPAPTATVTHTPFPTVTFTPSATLPPQDLGPTGFPATINPLTGLAASDRALLERRPMAVKIQMFPRGQRPPWGLSQADIVFDYYQNDGLTRLYAIFYGNQVETIGPIRSARLLDNRLTRMYKTIFAFGGADQRILDVLFNSEYADRLVVQGSTSPLWREDPNGANYLLGSTKTISEYVSGKGVANGRQVLDGMKFQLQPPAGGTAGTQVSVRYSISSYTRWDYDAASGAYLRFQDTQEDSSGQGESYTPLTDRLNNQQISAENVVVVFAAHDDYLKNGRYNIVDILLDYTGLAYLYRDGQAYQVSWFRPALDSVLTLVDSSGNAFPFKQGNTWFQVVGQLTQIPSRGEGGVWRFESRIP
jgi:hypothetical protein